MAEEIELSELHEESWGTLGQVLSEWMTADQCCDPVELPDLEKLCEELPGIDLQEVRDAFLGAGIMVKGSKLITTPPTQASKLPSLDR